MNGSIMMKVFLVLPAIAFTDFIILTLFGCISGALGFGNDFFCGYYCFISRGLLIVSALLFIYLILPDIKKILARKNYGPTS